MYWFNLYKMLRILFSKLLKVPLHGFAGSRRLSTTQTEPKVTATLGLQYNQILILMQLKVEST